MCKAFLFLNNQIVFDVAETPILSGLQLPVDKLISQLGGAQPEKMLCFLHQLIHLEILD